ncbi:hypothetical protein CJJ17_09660 [Gordonia polyisoprenivorans]|nr:hypothetical protein CJJ17_09660 [Gordonia polyisoprenivorans]
MPQAPGLPARCPRHRAFPRRPRRRAFPPDGRTPPTIEDLSSRWSRCEPRAASLETRRDNQPPNHIHQPQRNPHPYHTPPTENCRQPTNETRCPQAPFPPPNCRIPLP